MQQATKRFYVYILSDDGTPFYVGKGQKSRVHQHEKEAKKNCECPKCQRIRAVWASGFEITKSIVFESDDETEVMQRERDLIAHYGLGNLCNRSSGGQRGGGGHHEYIQESTLRIKLCAEFKRTRLDRMRGIEKLYWRKEMRRWVDEQIEYAIRAGEKYERDKAHAQSIAEYDEIHFKHKGNG